MTTRHATSGQPARLAAQLTILLLAALLLGGCASAATPAPTGPSTGDTSTSSVAAPAGAPVPAAGAPPASTARDPLRVVYVARNGAVAVLWVAHEAGIFARHGIDAELQFISSGTLGMQALLAREVDIGIVGASPVIAANLNGADAIYIAAVQKTFGFWIYGASEIASPTDLRGKRVGITRRNSTSDVAIGYYLDKYGLAPDRDVPVVEIGDQAAMLPALATGAIAAAVMSDPATFLARRDGYREIADLTQLGLDYPQSAIGTTRALATERRDLVERFLRAVYEATHRYKTDRELSLKVLAKYLESDDPELLNATYDLYAGRLVQNAPRATYDGARTVLGALAAQTPDALGADPARFLDLSFVEALDREGLEARLYGR